MRHKIILGVILRVGLLAWSPWLSVSAAKFRAVESFNRSWDSITDGCGAQCNGCGTMPADTSDYHQQMTGFVSAIGTVHGFPGP